MIRSAICCHVVVQLSEQMLLLNALLKTISEIYMPAMLLFLTIAMNSDLQMLGIIHPHP
jgi:hypothetical protein